MKQWIFSLVFFGLLIPQITIAYDLDDTTLHQTLKQTLKSTNHKVGRTNLKQVKALCIKQKTNESTDYMIGLTFITEKNQRVSPGLGANFSF